MNVFKNNNLRSKFPKYSVPKIHMNPPRFCVKECRKIIYRYVMGVKKCVYIGLTGYWAARLEDEKFEGLWKI
jgi:predicted esterase YcpF (UPF0227 family)